MKFSIGQFIKLDDAYYIVAGLTESGRPNKVYRANKYGVTTGGNTLYNQNPDGWDVDWQEAVALDPKHAKYEKVIAKMKQLDRKFQNRDLTKKDLTYESVLDILTRLTNQRYEQS